MGHNKTKIISVNNKDNLSHIVDLESPNKENSNKLDKIDVYNF